MPACVVCYMAVQVSFKKRLIPLQAFYCYYLFGGIYYFHNAMKAIDIQKQNSGSFELSKKKNLREMFNNPLFLLECTIQI